MQCYDIIEERKGQIVLLILIAIASLIDGLDSSIVNVVLPNISAEFEADLSLSTWAITAYLAGIVGLMLLFGKIADNGRLRSIFVSGIVIFTLSSLFCALSQNIYMLIVFRFVQGLGASMMVAATPIMIVRLLPPGKKAAGMATMTMVSGISLAIGPSVGGLIADALSWHWVFLINIPIGIVLCLMTARYVPHSAAGSVIKMPDSRLSIYMFMTFCFGLIFLETIIMTDVSMIVIAASGVMTAIGAAATAVRHKNADPDERIMDMHIFRNRDFVLVAISFLLTTMMAGGVLYLLPYYLQVGSGMSSTVSGLYITFASVFMIIFAVVTGRWCDRKGCKSATAVSIFLRIVFSAIFIFISPAWGVEPLLITLLIVGISFGISGTAQSTRMMHHSPKENYGDAASLLNIVNYLGSSLGVVAYAMAFIIATPGYAGVTITDIPANVVVSGFNGSAVLGVILAVIALICTLVVRNIVPKNDVKQE